MPTEHMLFDLTATPSFHTATCGTVCLLLVIICVITRIRTGRRRNRDTDGASEITSVEVVPYFIPWLGSAIPFGLRFQDFLAEAQFVVPTGWPRSIR
jgi:hypothetical protein